MINHSIFNDVLGPIMSGPSSSHSAGCVRIGLMTRLLFGREIQKANVILMKMELIQKLISDKVQILDLQEVF